MKKAFKTCKKHGEYFGYTCPICSEMWEEKERKDKLLSFINEHHEKMEIPKRFKKICFGDFKTETEKQKTVFASVAKYAVNIAQGNHNGGFLNLLGGVGTGKTHLACAVANFLLVKGKFTKYQTVNQVSLKISTAAKSIGENAWKTINKLTQADLLILDEIGTQDTKHNNYLFELINQRYNEKKPMIIISNLGLPALKVNVGERILDRMKHNGVFLGLNWGSYRR